MESTQELLERRCVSRATNRRRAEAAAREAIREGRPQAAAEAYARAAQDLGATTEILGIARDMFVDLDNDPLARRIGKIESESAMRVPEQAAQALGEEL